MSTHSLYRPDGVRITYDPYAMAGKYGLPGETDQEGFDPYSDSVGPGIYGGIVQRDSLGQVVIGNQYQNHNPLPGPVYAGGGYTPVTKALKDLRVLQALLGTYPDLVNDISTGGAQPLHNAGMSARAQHAVPTLVRNGADIEAVDTYGYTPMHRMASNNLEVGALGLLQAGADPLFTGDSGQTPMQVAKSSGAERVVRVLQQWGNARADVFVHRIIVASAGLAGVNGHYTRMEPSTAPEAAYDAMAWRTLAGGRAWFKHDNGSHIFFHAQRRVWVMTSAARDDGQCENGPVRFQVVYEARGPSHAPPAQGWEAVGVCAGGEAMHALAPPPSLRIFRSGSPTLRP